MGHGEPSVLPEIVVKNLPGVYDPGPLLGSRPQDRCSSAGKNDIPMAIGETQIALVSQQGTKVPGRWKRSTDFCVSHHTYSPG